VSVVTITATWRDGATVASAHDSEYALAIVRHWRAWATRQGYEYHALAGGRHAIVAPDGARIVTLTIGAPAD